MLHFKIHNTVLEKYQNFRLRQKVREFIKLKTFVQIGF